MPQRYKFEQLGMLGQMYDEADEEANFPKGTLFYLASDIDQLFEKDSARTKEHNLLVSENRRLRAAVSKCTGELRCEAYKLASSNEPADEPVTPICSRCGTPFRPIGTPPLQGWESACQCALRRSTDSGKV